MMCRLKVVMCRNVMLSSSSVMMLTDSVLFLSVMYSSLGMISTVHALCQIRTVPSTQSC